MTEVLDIDQNFGHFALYTQPTTGPVDDPLYLPLNHLDKIKIHSALSYLQVAFEFDITINHVAVTASRGWDWSTFSNQWYPEDYTIDRLLGTHNLGFIPTCIVSTGSGAVDPGMPIQSNGSGGTRYLDIYMTTTEIRAKERVDSGTGTLSASTKTYKVLLLAEPATSSLLPVFEAEDGRVAGGMGLFDSEYHYLRAVAAGESPYFIGASQQIDCARNVCRFIDALGNITHDFYNAANYNGSLSSVTAQQVQR